MLFRPAPSVAAAHNIDLAKIAGTYIDELVEEIDLYPSLLELHGITPQMGLQGRSWVPLLRNESQADRLAFSQYQHSCQSVGHCRFANGTEYTGPVMGYSMRTHEFRYTEWCQFHCGDSMHPEKCSAASVVPRWSECVGTELYDHRNDTSLSTFAQFDNVNLARDPAFASTVAQLSQQLHSSWPKPPPEP